MSLLHLQTSHASLTAVKSRISCRVAALGPSIHLDTHIHLRYFVHNVHPSPPLPNPSNSNGGSRGLRSLFPPSLSFPRYMEGCDPLPSIGRLRSHPIGSLVVPRALPPHSAQCEGGHGRGYGDSFNQSSAIDVLTQSSKL